MEACNNLPKDIEIEILCRLPVKSLLRFNCVCKSWNTLIKSSTFIHRHLYKSISSDCIDYCLLISYDPRDPKIKYLDTEMFVSLLSGKSMEPLINIEVPNVEGENACIVGTRNGIICLYYDDKTFALFNPATKKFKVIPSPPKTNEPYVSCYYHCQACPSFGFDAKCNDYKLLKIWYDIVDLPKRIIHYIFQIYSLHDDSWKEIHNIGVLGFPKYFSRFEVYREGVYHLMTTTDEYDVIILSFDLHNETFGKWKGPYVNERPAGHFDRSPSKTEAPAILNGNLAFVSYEILTIKTTIGVWVMQEYGNDETWVKKYTIGPIHAEPICFWKDTKLLLQTKENSEARHVKGELVSYDLITQESKGHKIYGSAIECYNFVPSLLPLESLHKVIS